LFCGERQVLAVRVWREDAGGVTRTSPNDPWRRPAVWAYIVSLPLVFQMLYVLYERAAVAPVGTLEWSGVVAGVLAAWSASFWVVLFFCTRLARRVDGFLTTVLQGPNR
jgi:hypothetical protein